jgi:hypothetical protein
MKPSKALLRALAVSLAEGIRGERLLHGFEMAATYPTAFELANLISSELAKFSDPDVIYDVVVFVPKIDQPQLVGLEANEVKPKADEDLVVFKRNQVEARAGLRMKSEAELKLMYEQGLIESQHPREKSLVVIFPGVHRISSYENVALFHDLSQILRDLSSGLLDKLSPEIRSITRIIGLDRWVNGHELSPHLANAGPMSIVEFLLKISEHDGPKNLGRMLHHVGLVPDARSAEPGATTRLDERALQQNVDVIKALGRNPAKGLLERFELAGVNGDPNGVREALIRFLQARRPDEGRLVDVGVWGPDLVATGDELLFDKWLLHSAAALPIHELTIVPFRDNSGKVTKKCKLRQDEPFNWDAPAYTVVAVDSESQEVISVERIVVEWTTKPVEVDGIAKWEITIEPPAYARDPLSPVILARRKVAGHLRKATISLTEVDPAIHPSGTRVVVRVRALDIDGNYVLFAGRDEPEEVDRGSDEFEIQYTDPSENEQKDGKATDNSPSLAFAVLDAVTRMSLSSPEVSLTEQLEDDLVKVSLREPRKGGLHARYLVRSSAMLSKLQRRLLEGPCNIHGFTAAVSGSATLTEREINEVKLNLPDGFISAREKYFNALRESAGLVAGSSPIGSSSSEAEQSGDQELENSRGDTRLEATGNPGELVEFARWREDSGPSMVSLALDEYVRCYLQCLKEGNSAVLSIDTIEVSVTGLTSMELGIVLLPTHPLRSLWFREYDRVLSGWAERLSQISPDKRESQMDLSLCRRISPANQPFVIVARDGQPMVWAEEPIFGYGFFMSPQTTDYEGVAEAMLRALGVSRSQVARKIRADAITRAFISQIDSQIDATRISILALNPGSGDLIASAIESKSFETDEDGNDVLERSFDVLAYSGFIPYSLPLSSLTELQDRLRSFALKDEFLFLPPLGIQQRPRYQKIVSDHTEELLSLDNESAHIAIAHGLVDGYVGAENRIPVRGDSVLGLICPLVSGLSESTERAGWHIGPPRHRADASVLVRTHHAHLEAVADLRELGAGVVGIHANLDGRVKRDLMALHQRSERVALSDRFASLEWFRAAADDEFGETYILDYAPDFVEGFGDRVIISTAHKEEFLRIFEQSLESLGLDRVGSRQVFIDNLLGISGRLALQLVGNNPQAHEAAGLAITIEVLREKGALVDHFIVPIDSHPELFGAAARFDDEPALRCDMLLVKLVDGRLIIRCVEVKTRNGGVNDALRSHISAQLHATQATLRTRFLAADPRVDQLLQLAHFRSILHHYLDRAVSNGAIDGDKSEALHDAIEAWTSELGAEITLEGYIVSINETPKRAEEFAGVVINYICGEDLEKTRLSSRIESVSQSQQVQITSTKSMPILQPCPPADNSRSSDNPPESASPGASPTSPPLSDTPPMALADPRDTSDGASGSVGSVGVPPAAATVVEVDLGTDQANNSVIWNIETKGSPHAFIVGSTGAGKSVTTRRIINSFSTANVPTMILDYHGDMADNAPPGAQVLSVIQDGLGFHPFDIGSDPRQLNASLHEIAEVVAFVCDLGVIQQTNVYRALVECFRALGWANGQQGQRLPTMDEFADAVESVEKGAQGKNARARIMPITDFGLFRDDSSGFNPRGLGKGLVIDLRGLLDGVQLAASAFILRKLYREMFSWPADSTMKLAAVLDEAHRFAKDRSLPKILKEGRKYGVSVIVASQSVDDFDKNVLVNCGTKIVFRTNFPESKVVAKLLQGQGGRDLHDEITKLPVGNAFVTTPTHSVRRVQMKM